MALVRSFSIDQVQCVNADGGDARYPASDGLELRMDASWAPYIQGTLTGTPPSLADVTAIDPRKGWRTRFRVRSFDGTGTVTGTLACDLDLRSRGRTHRAERPQLRLDVASSEARLQDYAFGTQQSGGDQRLRAATEWAGLAVEHAGLQLTVRDDAPNGLVAAADTGWDPDTKVWDYVAGLAESVGARVFCDENNVLVWAAPTYAADTATRAIAGIIEVDDTISRDDAEWANFAVVAYTGNSPTEYVVSDSGAAWRKSIVRQRSRRRPGTGNAATKIRTTAQARGRNLTVTAIADLSVRPNQKRTATYDGQTWQGSVQSVGWSFPAGTMRLVLNVVES